MDIPKAKDWRDAAIKIETLLMEVRDGSLTAVQALDMTQVMIFDLEAEELQRDTPRDAG